MDRRQRLNDPTFAVGNATRNQQAKMWTALPGIVQSFDAAKMTAEVQPSIKGVQADPKTLASKTVDLPLLVDCPVCFPGFGDALLTFPIASGDECLVVFASRCIDAWWQNGGVQPPMVYRMHDLSDGFVIPGGRSQPNVVAGISTSTAQLRSKDGSTFIDLDPAAQKVTVEAPGGFFVNGVRFDTHVHGGVQSGSSETLVPQ